jgi:hypothetical protein
MRPDFGGKPNVGNMDPLWAKKIAAAGQLDLMKNINIRFNTQCGLRGMTEPTELMWGDQVTDTGNIFLFQDASGNDMVEIKNFVSKTTRLKLCSTTVDSKRQIVAIARNYNDQHDIVQALIELRTISPNCTRIFNYPLGKRQLKTNLKCGS